MLLSHLENVSCILGVTVRIQASVQMQYISKLFSLSKQRRQAKYLPEKKALVSDLKITRVVALVKEDQEAGAETRLLTVMQYILSGPAQQEPVLFR